MEITIDSTNFEVTNLENEIIFSAVTKITQEALEKASIKAIIDVNKNPSIKQYDIENGIFSITTKYTSQAKHWIAWLQLSNENAIFRAAKRAKAKKRAVNKEKRKQLQLKLQNI